MKRYPDGIGGKFFYEKNAPGVHARMGPHHVLGRLPGNVRRHGKMDLSMKKISVQFTAEELRALVKLADNQFFRLKYIDPKMPGYKANPQELRTAQSAVQVLQEALKKESGPIF